MHFSPVPMYCFKDTVHQITQVPGKRDPLSLDIMLYQRPSQTLFLWPHFPIDPMLPKLQDFLNDMNATLRILNLNT